MRFRDLFKPSSSLVHPELRGSFHPTDSFSDFSNSVQLDAEEEFDGAHGQPVATLLPAGSAGASPAGAGPHTVRSAPPIGPTSSNLKGASESHAAVTGTIRDPLWPNLNPLLSNKSSEIHDKNDGPSQQDFILAHESEKESGRVKTMKDMGKYMK